MNEDDKFSRRSFLKTVSLTAIAAGIPAHLNAKDKDETQSKPANLQLKDKGGPYNILMIVTDQERYMTKDEFPSGFDLPGHERLAAQGTVFENHQVASCVCTPSRAVMYTGQHIQKNGMFDNTNFPWSGSMSTDIDTVGDLLRKQGYYTAYKGKWHLTEEFETINDSHNPTRFLADEMEKYGFSDYFGIGDVIAHTQGGFLHDNIISAMSKSWLRGKGEELRSNDKPWFLAVNLVNPHDVMYYNTDLPDQKAQSNDAMLPINREPKNKVYEQNWDVELPTSRNQALNEKGRPKAHLDYQQSRGAMVGVVPNEDDRWKRLNNYYFNCIKDVDNNIVEIFSELDELGIADNTIVIFTADHGELAGAHGLSGKGATAYQEQNNVPFMMVHPAYQGNKKCKAVTSHVDIATTLLSLSGGDLGSAGNLPGKDISSLLPDPESAKFNTLREGALYNYNMFAYIDQNFFKSIGQYFAQGGDADKLGAQGFKPNLRKRGAIRSIFDGRYKFSRYYSPLEHHTPTDMQQLFTFNDLELYDLQNDPNEMNNLARDTQSNRALIETMNNKLNVLIEQEVGDDVGQMLPTIEGTDWQLSASIKNIRL
jgi:arylsulfatase A-like enzyme